MKRVFWAVLATAGILCGTNAGILPARAEPVRSLHEDSIRVFVQETSEISSGQRAAMTDEEVTDYFLAHISPEGRFKSALHYEIPGYPVQDGALSFNRDEYIAAILSGRHAMEEYRASIEIQDLEIRATGKKAAFTTIIVENGRMAMPKDPAKPEEAEIIPVEGRSTCLQKLSVSAEGIIQMDGAECETTIRLDPFAGKPLVP